MPIDDLSDDIGYSLTAATSATFGLHGTRCLTV
jgi:hypothetical protein